jgi:hypothetical protein
MMTDLALASLVAGIHLINHVNATTAASDAACGVAKLYRLKRINDFHGTNLQKRMNCHN